MKQIPQRLLSLLLSLLFLLSAGGILIATGETPEPTASIERFNLTFETNIYIKYAVKATSSVPLTAQNFRMLFWTEPKASYTKGSEALSLPSIGTQEIDGESYYIFAYEKLAAKQMTDNIYARVCIEFEGRLYYSKVEKYSILQYAYNKLGKTGTASENENLKAALIQMLEYGAAMQSYFQYETHRPADASYYQVKVTDGQLYDGTSDGLFLPDERVHITAPERNSEGLPFLYWADQTRACVSDSPAFDWIVPEENSTLTPIYLSLTPTSDEHFTFQELSDGTYTVSIKDPETAPEHIVIPATHSGKAVTGIGYRAFSGTAIKSVIIPDSVTDIGEDAFYGVSLSYVSIPSSVESIGDYAFFYHRKLAVFNIPGSVNSIGKHAFDLSGIRELTIEDGVLEIGEYAFYQSPYLRVLSLPGSLESIGEHAFAYCTALEELTLHDGISAIPSFAFAGCEALTRAELPRSITSLGSYAFHDCTTLSELQIPDGITSLPEGLVQNCSSLTSILIPKTVSAIGASAFYGCTQLQTVYFAGSASEWSAISVSSGNTPLTEATVYCYSEAEPMSSGYFWRYADGIPTPWEVK